MKVGDIITNKNGDKAKILMVNGLIIFRSKEDDFHACYNYSYTEKVLVDCGWILPKEQWVPEVYRDYHFIDSSGNFYISTWNNNREDSFRLSIGNVHKTAADCEAYKQKLITKMSE